MTNAAMRAWRSPGKSRLMRSCCARPWTRRMTVACDCLPLLVTVALIAAAVMLAMLLGGA